MRVFFAAACVVCLATMGCAKSANTPQSLGYGNPYQPAGYPSGGGSYSSDPGSDFSGASNNYDQSFSPSIPPGRYVVGQDQANTILSLLSDLGTLCNQYSPTSIKNWATPFGNPQSPYAAYNPAAPYPPVICDYDGQNCNQVGYLSKNYMLGGTTDPSIYCGN